MALVLKIKEQSKMTEEKQPEDWMAKKWRPAMGWMYMVVCMCDFVVFPVLWSILQALVNHGHVETQWNPITLQGAGLFHMAMGAVLGIAAYGRTQEKLGGVNNGGMQPVAQSVTTTFSSPQSGLGATTGGFGSPAPTTTPTSGFGSVPTTPIATSSGKLGPASNGGFGAPL